MSKFTQEKWEIAADGCIEIYSENGLMIKGIAEVAEFDTEEGKANARLIASAPEMYELLDNVGSYLLECQKAYLNSPPDLPMYADEILELLDRIDHLTEERRE